jgi:hypothetical protein
MKTTATKLPTGEIILDGKACPFRAPLLLPGRVQGAIDMQHLPCSSVCPLFQFHEAHVVLKCTGTDVHITLDEVKELPQKPNFKIN